MAQLQEETLKNHGKTVTRYWTMRNVMYNEQFRFWSANELPRGLWQPKYAGHAILYGSVAHVLVNNLRTKGITDAIVDIDPALQPLAESSEIQERMHVGSVVVASTINSYLQGELDSSPGAVKTYCDIINSGRAEEDRKSVV